VRTDADMITKIRLTSDQYKEKRNGRKRSLEASVEENLIVGVNGHVTADGSVPHSSIHPIGIQYHHHTVTAVDPLAAGPPSHPISIIPTNITRQSSTGSVMSVTSNINPSLSYSMNNDRANLFPHEHLELLKKGYDANLIRRTYRCMLYTQYHIINESDQFIKLKKSHPTDSECAKLIKSYYPTLTVIMLAKFALHFPLSESTRNEEREAIVRIARNMNDESLMEEVNKIIEEVNKLNVVTVNRSSTGSTTSII